LHYFFVRFFRACGMNNPALPAGNAGFGESFRAGTGKHSSKYKNAGAISTPDLGMMIPIFSPGL
jgi:hypothetical protein